MLLKILHTNDMHGTLTKGLMHELAALREGCDLYFDTGDAIKTGNLGIPLRPETVWPMLQELCCSASVPGNRESHVLAPAFEAKLAGVGHPMLCANLRRRDRSRPLPPSLIVESSGVRIGLVGVMVPMVTERMKTQSASAYLWDPPIPSALAAAELLIPCVDVLFALTHIGHKMDLELAAAGRFDAIFGGHSHTVLQAPLRVGDTWIAQGGSHNRFAGVYEWDGELRGGLIPLKQSLSTRR